MAVCDGKKDSELACYELAMKAGIKGKGRTKRLLMQLQGKLVERNEGERPDLIFDVPATEKHPAFYLGVEHFLVDQASEELNKKPGKFISKSAMNERAIRAVFDEKVKVDDRDQDSWGRLGKLTDRIASQMKDQSNSSYYSFIKHMSYVVDGHLGNVDDYKRTVSKECGVATERVRIAFLIDVRTNFLNLFVNRPSGKMRRCLLGELPMFEDVVAILERLQGVVDYAILVMNQPLGSSTPKVIAFKCDDIRGNLEKHRECVYTFASTSAVCGMEDGIARDFEVDGRLERKDSSDDLVLRWSFSLANEEAIWATALEGTHIAWRAKQRGEGFIADMPVQLVMAYYGDCIKDWAMKREPSGNYYSQPIVVDFDKSKAEKRLEAFTAKWIPDPTGEQLEVIAEKKC